MTEHILEWNIIVKLNRIGSEKMPIIKVKKLCKDYKYNVKDAKKGFLYNLFNSNEKIANELTRIFNLLHIHPEKDITSKMILDYFQATQCWVKKQRGYLLISELV